MDNMRSMLVNNGAARKLRSLFFLLFMVGIFNVANATTWYADPTGATVAVITGNTATSTGLSSTNVGSPVGTTYSGATGITVAVGDIIVVQTGSKINVTAAATVGGIVFSGGQLNMTSSSALVCTGHIAGDVSGTSQGSGIFTYNTSLGSKPRIQMSGGSLSSPKILWVNLTNSNPSVNSVATSVNGYFALFGNAALGGTTNTIGRVLIGNSGAATSTSLNLNGYSLTCDFYGGVTLNAGTRISNTYGSNSNYTTNTGSSPAINIVTTSTATASTLYMDQTTVGTTDKVAITMNNSSGLTLSSGITLAGLTLTSGKVTMGNFNITGAASVFASGSSTSYLAVTGTGTVTANGLTSSSTVLPIGTSTAYTPVTFANTTGSPNLTIGVAALTTSNVVTSGSCAPFQWNITSTVSGAQSDITFTSNSTTGISSTSQLGVLTTGNTGYAAMTTTLANASSSSGNSATFNSYTLPANITLNTFFVGAKGSVYPLPTITNSPTLIATSATLNNPAATYSIGGTNILNFSSTTGLPAGLSISTSGTATNGVYTGGQITGTPTSSVGSPYTVSIVATNIAGTATASLAYTVNANPTVTSSLNAVALVGGTFNYTITASGGANSFNATLPTTNSLSSSLSLSGSVISGTLAAGTAGTYSIPLTATNTSTTLSCTACPTLTLTVLDVPAISSISPNTGTVNGSGFNLTVNGSNFASGSNASAGLSTVYWGATALTTTYVSATQLTATVPSTLIASSVSSSSPIITVVNTGSNTTPTTPATVSITSTVNANYTITALTPTITAISPSAAVAGGASFIIIVRGTNLSSLSQITWAGSPLTTTYVAATTINGTAYAAYLSATVPNTSITTAGTASVGITNNFADVTTAITSSNQTFTIYPSGASWAFTTNGAPVTGTNIGTTTTFTSVSSNLTGLANVNFVSSGLSFSPAGTGTSTSATWPAEATNGTPSFTIANIPATFNGFNSYLSSATPTVISRYAQFDIAPNTNFDFVAKNIVIPISNNTSTGSIQYAAAYSLDNWTTYTSMMPTSTNSATNIVVVPSSTTGSNLVNTAGNNWANLTFTPSSGINVLSGTTLSVRLLVYCNKNTGQTGTVNLTNVNIAGTSQAVYASPIVTSSLSAVDGTQNDVYTTASPLYQFTASTTSGTLSYSASGLPSGLTINSSTGKVTGTPTTIGTSTVTFYADNGNLRPTSQTITFNIAGPVYTPTISAVSTVAPPATAVTSITADAGSFTLYVTGTNFVSGSSFVTWNGTQITPSATTSTRLTVTIPASYILASNNTGSNTVQIGTYTTGAIDQTTSASAQSSNSTITFTINNPTPSISLVNPAGATTSGGTLTVYGTNFTSGSVIKWGGSPLTVLTQTSTQLTATIPTLSGSSAAVIVDNTLAGSTVSSGSKTFYIGNASATWSSSIPTLVPSSSIINSTITTTPTPTGGNIVGYANSQVQCYTALDGGYTTVSSDFKGLLLSTTTPNTTTTVTNRSVDFYIAPVLGYNLNVGSITIPVSASSSSGALVYSIGYSTDGGTTFTQLNSTTANSVGVTSTYNGTVTNTYDVSIPSTGNAITTFVPNTPFTITPSGNPLIIRVIGWRRSNSGSGFTVNVGPLTMVATSTQTPTPSAPQTVSGDENVSAAEVTFATPAVNGTSAISKYTVYCYTNPTGFTTSNFVFKQDYTVGSLTGSSPYTVIFNNNGAGISNGTTYYFAVTATNGSGQGTLSTLSNAVTPSATTTYTNAGGWNPFDPETSGNAQQSVVIAGNYTALGSFACTKLTVNNGFTFKNNFTITASSTIVNNGTINGTGTLVLANNATSQTISGTGTVANLTINTSAGVTITSGSNNLGITGVLTLQRGALTTNGNVTLKSTSITNTGTLAAIDGATNTGSISGTVTVERYIPAGFRGYRDLAPQVHNAGSIFNNWQEGGAFTSGKGIFITGPSATDANVANYATQPAPNSAGLDYSINGTASAYTFNNSNGSFYSLYAAGKIDSIYNTKTINLTPFTGYRVLVRGDRSFNLATTPIVNYYNVGLRMVNPTVLRATGNLITGTVTYSTSGVTNSSVGTAYESATYGLNGTTSKFSMIANPYSAPVRWGTGTGSNSTTTTVYGASANINASYWFLNPTYGGAGTYSAYNALSGSVYAGNTTSAYIQPGQAFFVQTSASSPTVVFKETAKETGVAKVAVFGAATSLSKIYFSLLKQDVTNNYNPIDAAAIAFHEAFTNDTYGPQDAIKFGNNCDNLTIADKGRNLSIDGRLPATANDKIPVNISNVSGTSYQLDIDATNYLANGFAPYFVDSYLGTTATLTNGINSFKFTVDAKVAASFENRFSIAFKPTTLAVNSIFASATLNNKVATISWNTIGEKGVSRFDVEKSTDAKNFVKIGQATAKNTSIATYTATDNNTTAATNYYRIKAISEVGTVSYSNVVQLSVNNKQFTVYPNPLVGKTLNVALTYGAVSKYIVTITSVLGQKVHEASFNHPGGSVCRSFTITNPLAAGTYTVTIRNASNEIVSQTNLSVN